MTDDEIVAKIIEKNLITNPKVIQLMFEAISSARADMAAKVETEFPCTEKKANYYADGFHTDCDEVFYSEEKWCSNCLIRKKLAEMK